MKITPSNIDDIIRAEKRKNKGKEESFSWGKEGFLILADFVRAIAPCKHGWFCFCGEVSDEWILDANKGDQGFRYMGATHYWDIKKNGYSVSVK